MVFTDFSTELFNQLVEKHQLDYNYKETLYSFIHEITIVCTNSPKNEFSTEKKNIYTLNSL